MVKIFITGSSGFIAKNIAEYYQIEQLFLYTKNDNLNQDLYKFNPDLIINCAAEIYNENYMWDSNVLLTKECLDYIKNNTKTQMIHIGSSSEYGVSKIPTSEKNIIDPVNMYQCTKGISTILAQGYARAYNLNITIIRPYSIYGRYEKPHRLFPTLWRSFILNEPMVLYNGYHDFVYIDDLITLIDLVHKYSVRGEGDIVNCGSGQQTSNLNIYKIFAKILNKDAPVDFKNNMNKPFESNAWVCDPSYALERYKFKTKISLEDGIRKFINTAKY